MVEKIILSSFPHFECQTVLIASFPPPLSFTAPILAFSDVKKKIPVNKNSYLQAEVLQSHSYSSFLLVDVGGCHICS